MSTSTLIVDEGAEFEQFAEVKHVGIAARKRVPTLLRDSCVYILTHIYDDGDGRGEQQKQIGVFTQRKYAEAALKKVKDAPGFKSRRKGFEISRSPLDQLGWEEGFIFRMPGWTALDPDDPRVEVDRSVAMDIPSWLFKKVVGKTKR